MLTRVKVPKLSANIQEVVITGWLKQEGDAVRKGEPIVEMTTEKAAFEFESPRNGILRKILAARKSALPVGYVFALVGGKGDPLPDLAATNAKLLARHRQTAVARPRAAARPGTPRKRVRATPAARRLARELKIDLADLKNSVTTDVITEDTVRKHANR